MPEGEKPGFGQYLRQAREAAGLTQNAVAEKLLLKTDLIDALEREDLSELPAPAYVRGYIRAYGQLLRCPVEELMARYNAQVTDEPELTRPVGVESYQDNSGAVLRWGSVGVVVVLLGLAGVWLYDYLRSDPAWMDSVTESVDSATDLELPESANDAETLDENPFPGTQPEWMNAVPEESAPGGTSGPDGSGASPGFEAGRDIDTAPAGGAALDTDSEPRTGTEPAADTGESAGSSPEQAAAGEPVWEQESTDDPAVPEGVDPATREVLTAPQGDDRLVLAFDGPSWVEAFDANGYRLVYGLFDTSDSRVRVRGKAPFEVVLGDATQVRLSINDSPMELDSYIRSNNTARLLVEPPDSQPASRSE